MDRRADERQFLRHGPPLHGPAPPGADARRAAPGVGLLRPGTISIVKAERRFTVASGVFIGEIAWLLGTPATATVEVSPGARYVEWDSAHLRSLLTRSPDLRIAFEGMLNRDLAGKLGKS